MTKFRSRAAFTCVVVSLSLGSFTARRGYPRNPPSPDLLPHNASASAITAEEGRAIAALPVIPPGLNQQYRLKVEPSKQVTAVYTCKVHAPRLEATNWIFFAPRPPHLPSQTISRTTITPVGTDVVDLSPLRRPLLRLDMAVQSEALRHNAAVEFRIEAELFSRRLVSSGSKGDSPIFADTKIGTGPRPAVANLTSAERRLALRPAGLFDYTKGDFRGWLARNGLTRGPKEGEVDFARRVFQFIAKNFHYEYLGDEQDRSLGNVTAVKKSDCGGLCILFAAALRSQGVPARALVGRWAISATHGKHGDSQEHVKAEFFAQGVGWVPVDLSSGILYDKSAEKLSYFGRDPGDHLAFTVDTDVLIDTRYFGVKTITWLQSACYWARGTGSFDGETTEEDWKVVATPQNAK